MTPASPVPHGVRAPRSRRPSLRAAALALDGVFLLGLAGMIVASSVFDQRGGDTLSDNWLLAGLGLGATAAALAGGLAALVALVRGSRERDLVAPLLIGVVALMFLIGESVGPH